MKKLLQTVLFTLAATTGLQAQNLILNGGAEMDMVNDSIPHWKMTMGTSWRNASVIEFGPATPQSGLNFFYPGLSSVPFNGMNVSELEQTIDLDADATTIDAGMRQYAFEANTHSYFQFPPDQAHFYFDFLDASENLLESVHLGPFDSVTEWTHVEATFVAPVNARILKVKMHSVLLNGTSNDGNYDDLNLFHTPFLGTADFNKVAFSVDPNPSSGIFHLRWNTPQQTTAQVFDLNGRLVHRSVVNGASHELDLQALQNGVYVLQLTGAQGSQSRKIIKN